MLLYNINIHVLLDSGPTLNRVFKRKNVYIHTPRRVHYSIRIRAPCDEHKVVFVSNIPLFRSARGEKKMFTIATLDQRART